jgi:hypothetical protein
MSSSPAEPFERMIAPNSTFRKLGLGDNNIVLHGLLWMSR